GQLFTAEELDPIGEFQVGDNDEGHALLQGGAELKHQLGPGGGKRDKAQFIQDDQVLFEGGGQEFGQAMLLLRQDQFVNQGGSIVKTDVMALPAGGQSKPGA